MEGIVAPGAQMWSAGGAGRQAMTRVGTGRREPGYFNMQEPLYVNCANPTSTSMAKPEEARDSEVDEVTAGSALGQVFHEIGECSPCAYFWQKADGCRLGDECQYCHLCDRDAIRRWKKAKKQRKKADAIRNAPTTCTNSYKKPAGVVNMPNKPAGVVNTSKNHFSSAAIEPVRVSLPVSMQSTQTTGLASLVGMSRPYLPLGVPPGLGFDFPVAAGKMGLGELMSDDDGTCFGPSKQLLVNNIAPLGGADCVDSNCQSQIPAPQASPSSRANTVHQFGYVFPYLEQRYADGQ